MLNGGERNNGVKILVRKRNSRRVSRDHILAAEHFPVGLQRRQVDSIGFDAPFTKIFNAAPGSAPHIENSFALTKKRKNIFRVQPSHVRFLVLNINVRWRDHLAIFGSYDSYVKAPGAKFRMDIYRRWTRIGAWSPDVPTI